MSTISSGVLVAARGAEDRPAVLVDVAHRPRGSARSAASSFDQAAIAVAEAEDVGRRRSGSASSRTSPRITLFSPGHSPPQVTMPTRVLAGSKKSRSRGPPGSNDGSSATRQAAGGRHLDRVVEQHPVRLVHVVHGARPGGQHPRQRRRHGRFTKCADSQVGRRDRQLVLGAHHSRDGLRGHVSAVWRRDSV